MPIDMIKTQYQKHDAELHKKSVVQATKTIYLAHGLKGFYAGWQANLIQYLIQCLVCVPMYEKFETRMRTLEKHS